MRHVWIAGLLVLACVPSRGDDPLTPVPAGFPPEAPFELRLSPPLLEVPQGGSAKLEVSLTRLDGFAGDVHVRVEDLPAGLTATTLALGRGDTNGTITVHALPSVGIPRAKPFHVRAGSGSLETRAELDLTVRGAPGSLDTSFGGDGRMHLLEKIFDVDALPDGRLLVMGMGANDTARVCRTNADGTVDETFGEGGCALFAGNGAFGTDVLIHEAGIYVIASAYKKIVLARLTHDGALDTSFGDDGRVIFGGGVDEYERPHHALLVEDGIVITGFLNDGITQQGTLTRVRLDGTLDESFGDAGRVLHPTPAGGDIERRVSGGFVVHRGDSLLAFTPSGEIDASFGGGVVTLPESTGAIARRGDEIFATGLELNVFQYSAGGAFVREHGDLAVRPWSGACDLVFRGDRMLLGGGAGNEEDGFLMIARRLASGEPDETFGPNGVHTYPGFAFCQDLEALQDGRYILAGTWRSGDEYSGVLLRVWD